MFIVCVRNRANEYVLCVGCGDVGITKQQHPQLMLYVICFIYIIFVSKFYQKLYIILYIIFIIIY